MKIFVAMLTLLMLSCPVFAEDDAPLVAETPPPEVKSGCSKPECAKKCQCKKKEMEQKSKKSGSVTDKTEKSNAKPPKKKSPPSKK